MPSDRKHPTLLVMTTPFQSLRVGGSFVSSNDSYGSGRISTSCATRDIVVFLRYRIWQRRGAINRSHDEHAAGYLIGSNTDKVAAAFALIANQSAQCFDEFKKRQSPTPDLPEHDR
jgi:hypothetical protein